ncbi:MULTISPECIES: phosphate signaling complex protein PhoU [unclassified Kitasatospora]|uniref:phosphate signaling complex protein PhoU n=1 Tax=unclassified Kitasatospora TaxID=2633591 RepID=UPI0033DECCCE
MARLAASAIGRATAALLDVDLQLAEDVIAADAQLDAMRRDLDESVISVLARQQPVATDLRILVSALQTGADLERAGDLARHVAELARRRYPDPVVPAELHAVIQEMGCLAQHLMAKSADILATREVEQALALESADDRMDDLHRALFQHLLDGRWQHGVQSAVDVTLAGRFYERFADHAVHVAEHTIYLITGARADDLPPEVAHPDRP